MRYQDSFSKNIIVIYWKVNMIVMTASNSNAYCPKLLNGGDFVIFEEVKRVATMIIKSSINA